MTEQWRGSGRNGGARQHGRLAARWLHALRQRQFLVFIGGGLLSSALDIAVLQCLLRADVGVSVAAATTSGFLAGLLLNYGFHARVTFGALHGSARQARFLRFLCVVGLNYLLTLACVGLALALATTVAAGTGGHVSEAGAALAGKLVSLPVVACNGFLLSKYWIFR